jgi:DNA-binding MarR family transcriptional regulator
MRSKLTYALEALADEAAAIADPIFSQKFGLRMHDLRILRILDDYPGGLTLAQLLPQTKMDRAAALETVAHLIKAEYLCKGADESDTAQSRLLPTAKAEAVRKLADPLADDLQELMLSALDPRQRSEFKSMLAALSIWLSSPGLKSEVQKRYLEPR